MNCLSRIPATPLNAYIDDLYAVEGAAPHRQLKIFPMPSLHVMVNLGDAFRVQRPDQADPVAICTESWGVGLWSTYHVVHWPASVRFFGIHFKPGGAYPFLQLPLSELHNQVVALDAIWGQRATEIRERLADAPTVEAGLSLFERLLLARLGEAPYGLNVIQRAVAEIARHRGALSIRALSDHIGISQNHLGTQFKRMVGLPAKELARFYRFAHVLRAITPEQPVDWALLARQSHFYDPSHLFREFAALTGYSPNDYLHLRSVQEAETTDHHVTLGQMPID